MQAITTEFFQKTDSKRNPGIDILRILAMFLVCALHCDEYGLWACIDKNALSQSMHAVWLNFTYMGVNLFMLITGYCCICTNWRLSRYISLYLQVAFYSLGYLILFLLISQDTEPIWKAFLSKCSDLPFAGGYWYFTTYTGLFFLIPFLNRLIHSLDSKQFKYFTAAVILVCSVLNTGSHSIISQDGGNLIWMIVCYILGAFIRTTYIPGKAINWFILFFVTLLVSTTLNYFFPILRRDYTSLIFISSCLCIFVAFTRIRIRNQTIQRLIAWAAPMSFGVYLFHNHPLVWETSSKAILGISYAVDFSWPCWLIAPAIIYTLGTGADWVRATLFKRAKINQLSDIIANAVETAAKRVL